MSNSEAWTSFWRAFHANGDLERPSLFPKGSHPGLTVSADSIFRATVNMCDQFRRMSRAKRITVSNIRFYIQGQRIEDPSSYLMQTNDGDFRGWHDRLKNGGDYCLVFNRLESTFHADIAGIFELVRPLVSEMGQPARRAEVTLFAGRYRKTPFGIHHDDEVNFFWPLIGPKRVRFWRPEYGITNPELVRLLEYDEHLSESMLLDAQAGDMLAWPGSWWHIAEGSDQFSVSLTIPLEWYPSSEKVDSGQLKEKLAKVLLRAAAAHTNSTLLPDQQEQDGSQTVPSMIDDAARLFSEIGADDIRDLLTERWLRKMTTAGLDVTTPIRNDVIPDDAKVIRRTERGPIRWARLSRGKICIASGGRSVVLPYSDAIAEIIGQLNASEPCSIASLTQYVATTCNDRSPGTVTKFVLTVLSKIGAVESLPADAGERTPEVASRPEVPK